jgi:hypothetical protein
MKKLTRGCAVFLAALPAVFMAETVGVFFAEDSAQIGFAASEVKAALESKRFTVAMRPLSALGGDANGAMYGGLQLAENIRFEQFSGSYSFEESPDKMYTGMSMARSADFPHWRYHDAAALQEYTSHGGVGIPDRPRVANLAVEFPLG